MSLWTECRYNIYICIINNKSDLFLTWNNEEIFRQFKVFFVNFNIFFPIHYIFESELNSHEDK